jgi:replicative DNA helicase
MFADLERQMSATGEMMAGKKRSRDIREIAQDCVAEAWQRHENCKKGKTNGIKTGFCDLDAITNGWQNTDFIVLAARPSIGKTAVAIKFMGAAALSGTPVAMFSLEMKDTQLVHRMIQAKITVNPSHYQSGRTSVEEMQRVEEIAAGLIELPITIDHTAGINMSYVRAQSKILKKQGKCGLIILDYLQLVREEFNSDRNREQAMSAISNACKCLAKELDVPVIGLSQLNRECEKRKGNIPTLADLRDLGAIEQDADVVIFVHRPDKYGEIAKDDDGRVIENYGELIVAKQRSGRLGEVQFTHNGSMTEFFDYDPHRSGYDVFNPN